MEGVSIVPYFASAGVSVLTFDFAGCGNSDGEYISLGVLEKEDVACAIDFVRSQFRVGKIAIWGRSMGAATAIMACGDDPTVAGAVCDSAFASLPRLVRELAGNFSVPGCLTTAAVWLLRRKIRELAHFELDDCAPINVAPACHTPVFFIHGEQDSFILPRHSLDLLEKWAGQVKLRRTCQGDHNSQRPDDIIQEAAFFLAGQLGAL